MQNIQCVYSSTTVCINFQFLKINNADCVTKLKFFYKSNHVSEWKFLFLFDIWSVCWSFAVNPFEHPWAGGTNNSAHTPRHNACKWCRPAVLSHSQVSTKHYGCCVWPRPYPLWRRGWNGSCSLTTALPPLPAAGTTPWASSSRATGVTWSCLGDDHTPMLHCMTPGCLT